METNNKTYRIAIVGSGPSGLYAAEQLLKTSIPVDVDLIEKLPNPYGLLRGGVAPDHQSIKNLTNYFEKIVTQNSNIHFYGNVELGKDVQLNDLQNVYDSVILAYGSESAKKLEIEGNNLSRLFTAKDFVYWYNGHPHYSNLNFELDKLKSVAVIGVGNVALDLARLMVKPASSLTQFDMPEAMCKAFANSTITSVHLIARRGPSQVAFTYRELLEISKIETLNFYIKEEDISRAEKYCELHQLENRRRIIALLKEMSKKPHDATNKSIYFHFFRVPSKFLGETSVSAIQLLKTKVVRTNENDALEISSETETLSVDAVFQSIGYRSKEINLIPFDFKKGIVPNRKGHVLTNNEIENNLFVVGWLKRGANGVVGSNRVCSKETVQEIERYFEKTPKKNSDFNLTKLLLNKNIRFVSFEEWKRLDEEEKNRGAAIGKLREKFISIEEMIFFLDKTK